MYTHKLTKEQVTDEFKPFVTEVKEGDTISYTVEMVPKKKLSEFRDNNVAVSKERDEIKAALTEIGAVLPKKKDGTAYTTAELKEQLDQWMNTAQRVADGKLKASDDVVKEVETRTVAMKATYEEQLRNAGTETVKFRNLAEQLETRIQQMSIDTAVAAAAGDDKLGVNLSALPDILSRARNTFTVDDKGKIVAKQDGVVLRGEDGVTPMTMSEWLKQLKNNAPYFFKSSTGGGATGGSGGAAMDELGGMTRAEFNALTPTERLRAANRVEAKKAKIG